MFLKSRAVIVILALSILISPSCRVFSYDNDIKKIEDVEKQLFEQSYPSDNSSDRLSRIEKIMFATTFNDSDNQRITRILGFSKQPVAEPAKTRPVKNNEKTNNAENTNSLSQEKTKPEAVVTTPCLNGDDIGEVTVCALVF